MGPQVKGSSPDSNLSPRECEACGDRFVPYRAVARVCSRRCYNRLPDRKAASSALGKRPETMERKNAARRVANNPDRAAVNRRLALARYGLTPVSHDAMFAAQGGVCAICRKPADPNGVRAASRLHVDHDHETGAVRALLCNNCNRGIGYLADSADLLRAAADYLDSHKEIPEC